MLGVNPYAAHYTQEAFREYVKQFERGLMSRVIRLRGHVRDLKACVIQLGDDPASTLYVQNKIRVCECLAIHVAHVHLKGDVDRSTFESVLDTFITDGIPTIVQYPVPFADFDLNDTRLGILDIDGLHKDAIVDPCTPAGIMCHLCDTVSDLEGKTMLVIGRSDLVGNPMVQLARDANMNVIQIHSKTSERIRQNFYTMADVIVCAVGKPNFITEADTDWLRPDTIIYDVGINKLPDGTVVGDCSPNLPSLGYAVSPVPGGVGMLTTRMFASNILSIYERWCEED